MIAEIKALLPALSDAAGGDAAGAARGQRAACGTCRSQAVVEIAELLELAPGRSAGHAVLLRLLQAGRAARRARGRGSAARSAARCAAARKCWSTCASEPGIQPGETTADGKLTLEFAECLGACEFAPCMLAGDTLHKNLTNESADAVRDRVVRSRTRCVTGRMTSNRRCRTT